MNVKESPPEFEYLPKSINVFFEDPIKSKERQAHYTTHIHCTCALKRIGLLPKEYGGSVSVLTLLFDIEWFQDTVKNRGQTD